MPTRTMSVIGVGTSLLDLHSTVLRILLLIGIFVGGYFERVIFGKGVACATWFWGLAALTAWIVYPLTSFRICAGAIMFVFGLALMVRYYRKAGGSPSTSRK